MLERQYASAKAWVDQVTALAGWSRVWAYGFQLGDWLDPAAPPDQPAAARTDPHLVATAYFAYSARRLGETAAVLGLDHDAAQYRLLAEEVRLAFLLRYSVAPGVLSDDTETAYALALRFELFDRSDRQRAGNRLAELVAERGHRIGVGFAGVNVVSDALSLTGHTESAYSLLLQAETPSWLSMIRKGATTIWERWDSMLDDGTVNSGKMTSFNHYALGSVADWMHRVIGGVEAVEPGYRRIRFAPRPGGGLTCAATSHESPDGRVPVRGRSRTGRSKLTSRCLLAPQARSNLTGSSR